MTNYGQNCTDWFKRHSPTLPLSNHFLKRESSQKYVIENNLGEGSRESCSYIMRIKGGRMICKVSRGKTLKTDPRRIFSQTLTASYFVQDIRPTLCATCPWKGEADENLPKWSWSPLSRSSSWSWSWSWSSVSCDVGVHQPNCRGPCRTFDNSKRKFAAEEKLSCLHLWHCFLSAQFPRTPTCGFPKGRNRTQF